MKQIHRVAIVGCGSIAGNHVKGILAAGQELCALCDVLPTQAQKLIEKHELGNIPVYTDYQEMLTAVSPDAVHICTPHYLHAKMCVTALSQNIHVLCEKPICISMEELDDVRRAVKSSHAQLGICLQNRYEPSMLRLRELAQQSGVTAGFGNVVWNRDEVYYASGAWRGTWAQEGGGVMINQAIHTLDLLQWICGMPSTVVAHLANDHLTDVIEVEDTVSARFACADGKILNFFATTGAGKSFSAQLRIKLADGSTLTAENGMLLRNSALLPTPQTEAAYGKDVWGGGHKTLIADFYGALQQNRPFAIGFSEAERVMRLVFGIYRSNGLRISVPQLPETSYHTS